MGENKDMSTPVRVGISIPTVGITTPEAYYNRLLFSFHLGKFEAENPGKFEFHWFVAGSMFTPMAREQLAENAFNQGMDFIFMIDDDMVGPIDLFEVMYLQMEEHPEIDILAPLAFTRNPPHLAVLYTCSEGFDPVTKQPYFTNNYVKNYPKDTLVECDAVGFGAALIRCDILKRMKKPWFMSTSPTGEDILFCYNAKQQANARVFMDTAIKLTHLSHPIRVDEEYAEEHWKEHGLDFKTQHGKYDKYPNLKEVI